MIKAIIVDDEQSARNVLEKLLAKKHPEIEVLDKCASLDTAIGSIKANRPDVVFLDVEMPKKSGFEIINEMDRIDFEIIFVTAYDNYAIRAFEISALDYLLKPVDKKRLSDSIEKLKRNLKTHDFEQKLLALQKVLASEEGPKFTVYHKGERQLIAVSDIIAIRAEHAYCHIYVSGMQEELMISKNLKRVERMLEGNTQFFRTHRSWIVNVDRMSVYNKSKCLIYLENGLQARLSKHKSKLFDEFIVQNDKK